MAKLQPILNEIDEIVGWAFYCPGCKSHHAPYVKPHANPSGASWSFNNNLENPTFNPSILTKVGHPDPNKRPLTCHLFVENGKIEYLGDCTHELAGKTVEMEEV